MASEVDRLAARNHFFELEFGFKECGYVRDSEFYSKLKVSDALKKTSRLPHNIFSPGYHAGFIAVFDEKGLLNEL